MKRLILIALATTMASTAADNFYDNPFSAGDTLTLLPQYAFAENPSRPCKKAQPHFGAATSETRFISEIPETINCTYPAVGVLNIAKVPTTITPADFRRLSTMYPNVMALGIDGKKIANPDIANFMAICENYFPYLMTLNVGYVDNQTAELFEQHAQTSHWKVAITRNPPKLGRRV